MERTTCDRIFSWLLIGLLGLGLAALGGCGGGGGGNVIPDDPVIVDDDTGTDTGEAPIAHVVWYDLLTASNLTNSAQTSNMIMLRERNDEYTAFLGAGYRYAVVGCYGVAKATKAAAIVTAAKAAQIEVPYLFFDDEPALNGKSVEDLNKIYDDYRQALDAAGHQSTKIAPVLSLAGTGTQAWDVWGLPKMDFIAHDSWYSGDSTEVHLVRDRLLRFLELCDANGLEGLDILHVLKVFSANTAGLDSEDLNAEWVLRQIRCATGSGTSTYQWTNPTTGEVATVTVEPLPEKYLKRSKTIAYYKMDGRDTDAEYFGANTPGLIEALSTWAKPRGLTLN